jgi:hypothetical protein
MSPNSSSQLLTAHSSQLTALSSQPTCTSPCLRQALLAQHLRRHHAVRQQRRQPERHDMLRSQPAKHQAQRQHVGEAKGVQRGAQRHVEPVHLGGLSQQEGAPLLGAQLVPQELPLDRALLQVPGGGGGQAGVRAGIRAGIRAEIRAGIRAGIRDTASVTSSSCDGAGRQGGARGWAGGGRRERWRAAGTAGFGPANSRYARPSWVHTATWRAGNHHVRSSQRASPDVQRQKVLHKDEQRCHQVEIQLQPAAAGHAAHRVF